MNEFKISEFKDEIESELDTEFNFYIDDTDLSELVYYFSSSEIEFNFSFTEDRLTINNIVATDERNGYG